jgi:hypothetical protein
MTIGVALAFMWAGGACALALLLLAFMIDCGPEVETDELKIAILSLVLWPVTLIALIYWRWLCRKEG